MPKGSMGKVRCTWNGTYLHGYKYQFAKNASVTNNNGAHSADDGAVARHRWTVGANWFPGKRTASVSQNFVVGYRDASCVRKASKVETNDLQSQWKGFKKLTLVLGIRNIFDRDPPVSAQGQLFQVGYDPRCGKSFSRVY